MTYICREGRKPEGKSWTGEIQMLDSTEDHYELIINARGSSFHVITGRYQNGKYLCVPNHGFGCDLAEYRDVFWNKEQISAYLNPVDTGSLTRGLSYLPEL